MKKGREINVKWKGPDGQVRQNSNRDLLDLLLHKELRKHYSKEDLRMLRKSIWKSLRYVRKLFKTHNLASPYHNFGHNYVTTITALRAVIGVQRRGEKLGILDIAVLLIAALFHDTGYLRGSKFSRKEDVISHSQKSRMNSSKFLHELKWTDSDIARVLDLLKFTNYGKWEFNKKKVAADLLAQILVGADLMQVVDANYFMNLIVLHEMLYGGKEKMTVAGQKKFFDFTKEATSRIWKHLDKFYRGKEENPYRERWEDFLEYMSMFGAV